MRRHDDPACGRDQTLRRCVACDLEALDGRRRRWTDASSFLDVPDDPTVPDVVGLVNALADFGGAA